MHIKISLKTLGQEITHRVDDESDVEIQIPFVKVMDKNSNIQYYYPTVEIKSMQIFYKEVTHSRLPKGGKD